MTLSRQVNLHPTPLTPYQPRPFSGEPVDFPRLESPNIEYILYIFKTQRCNYASKCTKIDCKFYHNETDKRRIPTFNPYTGFNYSWKIEPGGCQNDTEVHYHPMVYKTQMCARKKNCELKHCSYAHNQREIRHPSSTFHFLLPVPPPQIDLQITIEYEKSVTLRANLQHEYQALQQRTQMLAEKLRCAACRTAQRTSVASCCGSLLCSDCAQSNCITCKCCGAREKEVIKLIA